MNVNIGCSTMGSVINMGQASSCQVLIYFLKKLYSWSAALVSNTVSSDCIMITPSTLNTAQMNSEAPSPEMQLK